MLELPYIPIVETRGFTATSGKFHIASWITSTRSAGGLL